MRVAVVAESFLPQVNGVTNSVLRVLEHLERRGHDAFVVAPSTGVPVRTRLRAVEHYAGAPVLRAPSVACPGYRTFRVAGPWSGLPAALRAYQPDVVHLAAPTVLGAQAAFAAHRLGLPSVAVYQTDLAGFARRYGLGATERQLGRWLAHVHGVAGRTLAPSRAALDDLRRLGVRRTARWVRGVDAERFHPRHRDEALRARLAPNGELIVGYVGRLAHEKRVHLLAGLADLPDVRVVVVGDGPLRPALERRLPRATFLGFREGAALAAAFASLDVFVHPGADETFCQAAQEAKASGVPVVAAAAGGLLDLVEPGRTGLLFPPDAPRGLRECVAALAADPIRRHEMALEARASVAGRTWAAVGDELLGHYRDVMDGPLARAA